MAQCSSSSSSSSSGSKDQFDACMAVLNSTMVLLLLQADNYSAWNDRKRCCMWLQKQQQLPHGCFRCELHMCSLITSKHFKSGEAWSHRRWTLRTMWSLAGGAGGSGGCCIRELIEGEVLAVMAAVRMYRRNYYAWTHLLHLQAM